MIQELSFDIDTEPSAQQHRPPDGAAVQLGTTDHYLVDNTRCEPRCPITPLAREERQRLVVNLLSCRGLGPLGSQKDISGQVLGTS